MPFKWTDCILTHIRLAGDRRNAAYALNRLKRLRVNGGHQVHPALASSCTQAPLVTKAGTTGGAGAAGRRCCCEDV